MSKKKSYHDIFDLALRLFIITASVAILLAVVNFYTKDRIAINGNDKNTSAMKEIFPGCVITDITKDVDLTIHQDVLAVYAAKKNGVLTGVCVNVAEMGYGGEINMMVGVNNSLSVETVKIISAKETPGVGTKALSDEHLAGYHGVTGANAELKAVSGATISSKGVYGGITSSLDVAKELIINE